jgi:hypothetical protein
MRVLKSVLVLAAMATLLIEAPAFAHHSFAMFDNTKTVTLDGTIKDFQYTNPHSWIQLLVVDAQTGKDVEWSIEGGALNALAREGWTRHSLKPGDKATIVVHPLKSGAIGGSLVSVSINGAYIGRGPMGGIGPRDEGQNQN